MPYLPDDKVYLKHTGDAAIIRAVLGPDMYKVATFDDPDFMIPIHEEDLVPFSAGKPGTKKISDGRVKTFADERPVHQSVQVQYIILKPKGIQAGFDPIQGADGMVGTYNIWIINDTPRDFALDADLYVNSRRVVTMQGLLKRASALQVGTMAADDLNANPELEIFAQEITTAGLETGIEKILKIRAKQFFRDVATAPILNKPLHLYLAIPNAELEAPAAEANQDPDLRTYTRERLQEKEKRPKSNVKKVNAIDWEAFVNFPIEIDLHIEKLVNGYARMSNADMFRIQMEHFERYIADAIRHGVHRVHIIHGLGKGTLRDAVQKRLREMPHVKKYKNEFHPKYGHGSTEVTFDW